MAIITAATELNRLLDFLQDFSSRPFLTSIELIALILLFVLVSKLLSSSTSFLNSTRAFTAAAMPSAMRWEWRMSRLPRN